MLDWIGYNGQNILNKHVMDNSCGDGAFLKEVIIRYITAASARNLSTDLIRKHLSKYIHGIEIDCKAQERCLANLENTAKQFGLYHVSWDIQCADALTVTNYEGRMDYVVGNPPYVRIHNCRLPEAIRNRYTFIQQGNFDLYLAFFELGFRMLRNKGQLCYITPVSWFYSLAADRFRQHIASHKNLLEIVDMQHYQIFSGITSYTIVSRFSKTQSSNHIQYNHFNPHHYDKVPVTLLTLDEVMIQGKFYFDTKERLDTIRQIKSGQYPQLIRAKNGFATLADSLFFNDDIPSSDYTIPVLKVSKGLWYKGFFPYDKQGRPITEEQLHLNKQLVDYLETVKPVLMKRDYREQHWWLYGRSQAIGDVYKNRIAVNSLVRDENDLHIHYLHPGDGVYNGFYMVVSDQEQARTIADMLKTPHFIEYIRMHRIYKSGGYYEFRAKDLEQYINYTFNLLNKQSIVNTQNQDE